MRTVLFGLIILLLSSYPFGSIASSSPKQNCTGSFTLGVYPIIPSPLIASDKRSINKTKLAYSALTESLSQESKLLLLDRSASSHPLVSTPDYDEWRSSDLAKPADYIVLSILESDIDRVMTLELVHSETGEVVSHFGTDETGTRLANGKPLASSMKDSICADIKHRSGFTESPQDTPDGFANSQKFNISVASFFPVDKQFSNQWASDFLLEKVKRGLLHDSQFRLLSTTNGLALALESKLLPRSKKPKRPDIIVYGDVMELGNSNRLQLRLYLHRPGGLRRMKILQANSEQSLANAILREIRSLYSLTPSTAHGFATYRSREMAKNAWSDIQKQPFSAKGSFQPLSGKPIDKYHKKFKKYEKTRDKLLEAVKLDPANIDASIMLALVENYLGNAPALLEIAENLLWDSRADAFRGGQYLMGRYFNPGLQIVVDSHINGLSGEASPDVLMQYMDDLEYVRGYNKKSDSTVFIGEAYSLRHTPSRDNINASEKNRHLTDAAEFFRFRVARKYLGEHWDLFPRAGYDINHFARPINSEAAIYYTLSMAAAPYKLKITSSNKHSSEPEVFLDESHVKGRHETSIHRFLSLLGLSIMSDTGQIDMNIIHTQVACHITTTLCDTSQLLLRDTINNWSKDKSLLSKRFSLDRRQTRAIYQTASNLVTALPDSVTQNDITARHIESASKPSSHKPYSALYLKDSGTKSFWTSCDSCFDAYGKIESSTTDGQWLFNSERYRDSRAPFTSKFLPRRYSSPESFSAIHDWLFKHDLIDIRGYASNLDKYEYKTVRQKMVDDFPEYTADDISLILRSLKKSQHTEDGGYVDFFSSDKNGAERVSAPDTYENQRFGHRMLVAENRVWICDFEGNTYEYLRRETGWLFNSSHRNGCTNSMINDDWIATIGENRSTREIFIHFKKDHDDVYMPQTRTLIDDYLLARGLGKDYVGMRKKRPHHYITARSMSENNAYFGINVRINGDIRYALLHYHLQGKQWIPAGVVEVPKQILRLQAFSDFIVYKDVDLSSVWELTRSSSTTPPQLNLLKELEFPPGYKDRGTPKNFFLYENNGESKLHLHDGWVSLSYTLPTTVSLQSQ